MCSARTAVIGLDACDAGIAQSLMDAGRMPNLRALSERGRSVPVVPPLGLFVGGTWPTFDTGTGPASHGFYCWRQFEPGTYSSRRFFPADVARPPFWQLLSDAGNKVAVIDPPLSDPSTNFNGMQIIDWGSHDRWIPTTTVGPLAKELVAQVGDYPITIRCDHTARTETPHTLLDHLITGVNKKFELSIAALEADAWDLFLTFPCEAHCAGHQLWSIHDTRHANHDPVLAAEFSTDPIELVYEEMDRGLGRLLEAIGEDAAVFVILSSGFVPHYGGEHILGEILTKIEDKLAPSTTTRALVEHGHRLAYWTKKKARARFADGDKTIASLNGARTFFQIPNNALFGGIRFNLVGREPRGVVRPGSPGAEELITNLVDELHALRCPDTDRKLVTRVLRTDDHHQGDQRDRLPDLLIDWDRQAPINAATSETVGAIRREYSGIRSGDHRPIGRVVVAGTGVRPDEPGGASGGAIGMEDLAPTICQTLGFDLNNIDGSPIAELVKS